MCERGRAPECQMPLGPVHGAGLGGGNRGQCKGDSFRVKKSV